MPSRLSPSPHFAGTTWQTMHGSKTHRPTRPALTGGSEKGSGATPELLPTELKILQRFGSLLCAAIDSYIAGHLHEDTLVHPAPPPAAVDPPNPGNQIPLVVEELLLAKRADGASIRYLQTIRSHLHRFSAAFGEDIGSISTGQIDEWLRAQTVGPRARNNIRSSIITLFHFARKQGHLAKGRPTEADEIARAKDRGGKIGTLTPVELAKVMHEATAKSRLFLALGAFTGMRSSEIVQLEWSEVNFERSFIVVAPEKAKTATRRIVPIQPNLLEWLSPCRGRIGRLFRGRRDAAHAIAFAKKCGVEWPNNALRHSYATYRLAITADAARVALEMGNSPGKLMTNYRELSDQQQAREWFSIVPLTSGNVIRVWPDD
jgi:integrase